MEKVKRADGSIKFLEGLTGEKIYFSESKGDATFYYDRQKNFVTSSDNNIQKITSNIPITIKSKDGFSMGVLVPKYSPTAVKYLAEIRDYNDTNLDISKVIDLCNKLYYWEGIVSTAIDILAEFATTTLRVDNIKNEQARNLLEYFFDEVNKDSNTTIKGIQALGRQIILDWFISGNVFPYIEWDKVKDDRISKKEYILPMSIYLLNPANIEIPKASVEFGKKLFFLKLNPELLSIIKSPTESLSEESRLILRNVPKSIKEKIIDNKVLLDEKYVTHLTRKGRDYVAWGIPYLTRAFGSVAFKKKIKALDDTTTEGLINEITIFKIGDPKNPKTWDPNRLRRFAQLIAAPTSSMTLVWSYDIDIIRSSPNGEVLNFKDKYSQANMDILHALGIPVSLIAGIGTYQQSGDVNSQVLALVERLNEPRDLISSYLTIIARDIMVANGFNDEFPVIKWTNMTARTDAEIKNSVLAFFDRGLLSFKTALEEAGYDSNREVELRKDEKKQKLDSVFERRDLPFSGDSASPAGKGGNGRPTDKVNTKDKSKTKTFNKDNNGNKQKASAELFGEVIDSVFEKIYDDVINCNSNESLALASSTKINQLKNYFQIVFDKESLPKPNPFTDAIQNILYIDPSQNSEYYIKEKLTKIKNNLFDSVIKE